MIASISLIIVLCAAECVGSVCCDDSATGLTLSSVAVSIIVYTLFRALLIASMRLVRAD